MLELLGQEQASPRRHEGQAAVTQEEKRPAIPTTGLKSFLKDGGLPVLPPEWGQQRLQCVTARAGARTTQMGPQILKSARAGAQEPLSASSKASSPRRESSLKSPKTGTEGERMATRSGGPLSAPRERDSTTTAEEMTDVDMDGDDRMDSTEIETEVRGRQQTNPKETSLSPRRREGSRRILQAKRHQGVSVSPEKKATVPTQEEKSPSPTQVRQTSLTRRSSLSPKRRTREDWDFAEQDFDMEIQ
ncbi:hypothetical protein PF008_g7092 [Phytophthora fragariae]|nr:hypothetical protein PF003_g21812 [Phytophthora fragariae]KAE9348998.1 hypothetical protein PF008_g7092 [Phytophthora fragariae]